MTKHEAAGQFLKAKRLAAGLSREQLAENLHVGVKLIENWERGYQQPRHYVEQLAKVLNVEIGELRAAIRKPERGDLLKEEKPVSTQLGELIKTLREDAGMSQEKLAREISVAVRTVEHWETGKIRPSQHALGPLSWALGVSQKTLEAALSKNNGGASSESEPVQTVASPAPTKPANRDTNGGHKPAPSAPPKVAVAITTHSADQTNAPVVVATKPALTNINMMKARRGITMASKSIRSKLAVARLYGDDRVSQLAALIEADCDVIDDEAKKLSDDNE